MGFLIPGADVTIQFNPLNDSQRDAEFLSVVNNSSNLLFGQEGLHFDAFTEIRINETLEEVSSYAEISFPSKLKFEIQSNTTVSLFADQIFLIGDYVRITLTVSVPGVTYGQPPKTDVETNFVPEPIYGQPHPGGFYVFTGYVDSVDIGTDEIVVKVQDEMWALKQNSRLFPDDFLTGRKEKDGKAIPAKPIIERTASSSLSSGGIEGPILGAVGAGGYKMDKTTLEDILKVYLPSKMPVTGKAIEVVKPDSTLLANYRSDGVRSLAQVFEELRGYMGLYAYFREGKLYIGPQAWEELHSKDPWVFVLPYDRVQPDKEDPNIISHDLIYQRKDTVRFQVEVINVVKGVQKSIVVEGDDDGEKIKIFVHNLDAAKDKAQIDATIKSELDLYKYDGYAGSFTTFGAPAVLKGDIIYLYDLNPSGKSSRFDKYLVKAVDRIFSMSSVSYRQTIHLGRKIETT